MKNFEALKADFENEERVITNADHIRSMADEELASVIVRYEGTEKQVTRYGGHKYTFYGADGKKTNTREGAVQSWAYWLKQPYKEG